MCEGDLLPLINSKNNGLVEQGSWNIFIFKIENCRQAIKVAVKYLA